MGNLKRIRAERLLVIRVLGVGVVVGLERAYHVRGDSQINLSRGNMQGLGQGIESGIVYCVQKEHKSVDGCNEENCTYLLFFGQNGETRFLGLLGRRADAGVSSRSN